MKKKILTFFLCICFLMPFAFSLSGCTGGEDPQKPHTHSWSSTISFDRENHFFKCTGCEMVKDAQAHDFDTLNNGLCFICGFNIAHDCNNFMSNKYGHDENGHYFKCSYCSGNIIETQQDHEFNRDTCTICGYVDPDYVASSAPAVSKIHDLRIIVREMYTLIVFPDGKVAVIDPYFGSDDEGMADFWSMLPENDKDNDGMTEIDYLIFTTTTYIPYDHFGWEDIEVLNLYRPNIGFDPELVTMLDSTYYTFNGERFNKEKLKDIPEHLTTGVQLPYFDDYIETERVAPYFRINHEGRYDVPKLYVAAMYFAGINNINVIPIKPENSIHNTFSYLGREYSYSLDFLDLGIQFNAPESAFSYMVKDGYNSDEGYIDQNKNVYNQYVEYSSMFTITYNDFKMLYVCEASENTMQAFNTKYKNLDADILVLTYSHAFEIGAGNSRYVFYNQGESFIENAFDKTKNDENMLFINAYYWGKTTTTTLEHYFLYEDYQTTAAVKRDNYVKAYINDTSSAKTNIITACCRVNKKGEKTLEKWDHFSQNQLPTHWDDWN